MAAESSAVGFAGIADARTAWGNLPGLRTQLFKPRSHTKRETDTDLWIDGMLNRMPPLCSVMAGLCVCQFSLPVVAAGLA